jgi:hypothetical protein
MKKTLAVLFTSLALLGAAVPAASAAPGGEDNHCNSNQPGCRHK